MPLFLVVVCSIVGYFGALYFFSWYRQKRSASSTTQLLSGGNSTWWMVALSLVGTSISGVTFVSVPGQVSAVGKMYYFEFVLGNVLGFLVIAWVLLPLYYRLQLDSIYEFIGNRFGGYAHRTAAYFFMLSRIVGSSFRLYLGCLVLYVMGFEAMGVPFGCLVVAFTLFMWLYTRKGGIRNIIWTDFVQTLLLLGVAVAAFVFFFFLLPKGMRWDTLWHSTQADMFVVSDFWGNKNHLLKQVVSGALVTIAMSGLDQDSMQKNLKLKTLAVAQKNYLSFALAFVVTNFFFLMLGLLFYEFLLQEHRAIPEKTDTIFPFLASHYMGSVGVALFVVGIIAATFSSCSSSMIALATSFVVDIKRLKPSIHKQRFVRTLSYAQFGVALGVLLIVLLFSWINKESVVNAVFKMAGYTYGPLLGLFALGLFSKVRIQDGWTPFVAVLSVVFTFIIDRYAGLWFGGYSFGFELLLVNALFTMFGLGLSGASDFFRKGMFKK